jgi:hypothetical protein
MQPKDRQARTGRAAASRPDQVRRAEQNGDLSVGGRMKGERYRTAASSSIALIRPRSRSLSDSF